MSRARTPYWAGASGQRRQPPPAEDGAADVVVIGGGITGASAAYHLARDHNVDVMLLERENIAAGATGRNAGMVVPTFSKLTIGERLERWGPEHTKESGTLALQAVRQLRHVIEDESLDCDVADGGWVQAAHRPGLASKVAQTAAAYREHLGIPAEHLSANDMRERGLGTSPTVFGGVLLPDAFGVHPTKLVMGLIDAAARYGARIHTGTPVVSLESRPGGRLVRTPHATIRCRKVIVATDVTTASVATSLSRRLLKTTGAILVTEPLTDELWRASGLREESVFTDMRKVLFYWRRLPEGRLLFGGRGPTWEMQTGRHQRWLRGQMLSKFPTLRETHIEAFWTGPIGLTYDRTPHYGKLSEDVWFSGGYLGTGLALGSHWGATLAAAATSCASVPRKPWTGPLKPFPVSPLRNQYFKAARLAFELQDRFQR